MNQKPFPLNPPVPVPSAVSIELVRWMTNRSQTQHSNLLFQRHIEPEGRKIPLAGKLFVRSEAVSRAEALVDLEPETLADPQQATTLIGLPIQLAAALNRCNVPTFSRWPSPWSRSM